MKPDKPTNKERVKHIMEAIAQIELYTESHSLQSFSNDSLTRSACLYQYTIIAEATGNIDSSILNGYDYPWRKVKDFRNFILHEYEGVDARIVWDTTKKILPELKNIMETILKKEF